MKQESDPSRWIKQAGLLTSIPFALLIGPALGYYFGTIVERWCSCHPWGIGIGAGLGMVAAFRVVIQLINQAGNLDKDDH